MLPVNPPPGNGAVFVIVDPTTLMPVPAVSDVMPVFVIVTPPVDPETLMPVPAVTEVTPALEIVTFPVAPDTEIPPPATFDRTPELAMLVAPRVIPAPAVAATNC
jgi:hypothetical protein